MKILRVPSLSVVGFHTGVDCDSSRFRDAGEIAAIIAVLELPPSAELSMRVSLESRYGMCCVPFLPSLSLLMTAPSARSDLLIAFPSLRRDPVAPVFFWRSDPARSTRYLCRSFVF